MRSLTIVVLSTLLVGLCSANYCDRRLCQRGPHVGCNPPKSFGPACGNNVKFIPMDGKMKQLILKKHNQLRAEIANGKHGFPTAERMPTLVWDDELALLASYNAKTCVFAHDKCRNTQKFKFAGQNLAITGFYGHNYTAEDRTENFIQLWFDEHNDCPKSYIDSYPMNHQGPMIGHFTQVVSDRSWKVGCSLVHYLKNGKIINYYLVCNYSMTNMIGEPIYKKGRTASKCTTGQNPEFRGLCSPKEKVQSVSYNG